MLRLSKLDQFIQKRRENHHRLMEILSPYQDRLILPHPGEFSEPAWFCFVITVREDAGFTRSELTRYLEANRIETRPLFSGNLLRHPAFENMVCRIVGELKNTDLVMENSFFIGVYPGIGDPQLTWIQEVFDRFMLGGDRV